MVPPASLAISHSQEYIYKLGELNLQRFFFLPPRLFGHVVTVCYSWSRRGIVSVYTIPYHTIPLKYLIIIIGIVYVVQRNS